MTESHLPIDDEEPEDDEELVDDTPELNVPVAEDRDRAKLAGECPLNPLSLVGSWFHRIENDEIVWDGIVVAEVQPGKYLLQLRERADVEEQRSAQVLMTIEQMVSREDSEFRFYNDREAMFKAYAEHVVNQEVGYE